jgi:hypothetical protein
MNINTPNEAMRKTSHGALLLLRGKYIIRSMAIPRSEARIEAKKRQDWINA